MHLAVPEPAREGVYISLHGETFEEAYNAQMPAGTDKSTAVADAGSKKTMPDKTVTKGTQ